MNNNEEQYENGYPLGYIRDNEYYLNNHLRFLLKYHQEKNSEFLRVVGFEIEALSIDSSQIEVDDKKSCNFKSPSEGKADKDKDAHVSAPSPPQKLNKNGINQFLMTYEIIWQSSDIPWASRWDTYLKMNDVKIHWFSIINSLVVVFFLAGILSMILLRSLRRDIAKYNREDEPEEAIEESGWKLVHGDVFRPPKNTDLFVILIGTGIQLFSMSFVIIGMKIFAYLVFKKIKPNREF
jgi:transmembrane 9 superfamily member 2/4